MKYTHIVKAFGLGKFFTQETVSNYIAVSAPEISSDNIGDEIITEAVMKQLSGIFTDKIFVKFPTKTYFSNKCIHSYNMASMRFIGGSNLMSSRIRPCFNQWDISWANFWKYKSAILMGVGWQKYQSSPNLFAKLFYHPLLSKSYIHSVRDSYTESQMRKMGYSNVLNTACPTTWDLTPKHCTSIPKTKRDAAVITITDYAPDAQLVLKLIETVRKNYKDIYFFQQGVGDLNYLRSITDPGDMRIITPSLKAYDQLLKEIHPDFIGTRLHGGIRALQHSCRALIIGIDNRAIEMSKDINLPVITIEDLENLSHKLKNGWDIAVTLPEKNIATWKKQFS